MELNFSEKILIATMRSFHKFLEMNNYLLFGMIYGGTDGYIFEYRSSINRIEIYIVCTWTENGLSFDVVFNKTKLFKKFGFNLEDAGKIFPEFNALEKIISEENCFSVFNSHLEAVKKFLMPVIKGERWLSDFDI